jgi:spore maturation protein CgeB
VELPLSGLRVAITLAPPTWFGGIDYRIGASMADELRRLGATLLEVGVAGFLNRDEDYIRYTIGKLRAFRPDVAIGLPNGGYALQCTTTDGANVFRDVLEIPTIHIWDHGTLQYPRLLLEPWPSQPEEATDGCIASLRRQLDHPLFLHYAPDRGHAAVLESLGILTAGKAQRFVHFAHPFRPPTEWRQPPDEPKAAQVAFVGNVYLDGARQVPFRRHTELAAMEARVLEARRTRITESCWDLLLAEIDSLSEPVRAALRLDPDSTFFWRFLHDEIESVGTTEARINMLSALRTECDFFGNFMEPQAIPELARRAKVRVHKTLDCLTELPWLYRNSALIVDVINAGYNSGISPKIPSVLCCGGLVLFDYKSDFRDEIGELADLVMYRSFDQLNSMVDQYLADPRKRREVSQSLGELVSQKLTFEAFCRRVLVEQPLWRQVK